VGARLSAVGAHAILGKTDGGVSGYAPVLVNDAAEDIATDDLAVIGGRGRRAGERLVEIETAVTVLLRG